MARPRARVPDPAITHNGNEAFGPCALCGAVFDRSTIGRHVAACVRKAAGAGNEALLLHAQSVGRVVYWIELVVRRDAPLAALDKALRDVWLDEPCGHLSAFVVGKRGPRDSNWRQLVSRGYAHDLLPDPRVMPMSRAKADDVLAPRVEIVHEYDFGTTTTTTVRGIVGCGALPGRAAVRIVARNNAPTIGCGACEAKPARHVCAYCYGSDDALLCDACAKEHECGAEGILPWLNSPRTGLCGYGSEPKPLLRGGVGADRLGARDASGKGPVTQTRIAGVNP